MVHKIVYERKHEKRWWSSALSVVNVIISIALVVSVSVKINDLNCISNGSGSGSVLNVLPGCHVTEQWARLDLESLAANLAREDALLFTSKPWLEAVNFINLIFAS